MPETTRCTGGFDLRYPLPVKPTLTWAVWAIFGKGIATPAASVAVRWPIELDGSPACQRWFNREDTLDVTQIGSLEDVRSCRRACRSALIHRPSFYRRNMQSRSLVMQSRRAKLPSALPNSGKALHRGPARCGIVASGVRAMRGCCFRERINTILPAYRSTSRFAPCRVLLRATIARFRSRAFRA